MLAEAGEKSNQVNPVFLKGEYCIFEGVEERVPVFWLGVQIPHQGDLDSQWEVISKELKGSA